MLQEGPGWPTWRQDGPTWLENGIPKSWKIGKKIDAKTGNFLERFFDEVLEGFGSEHSLKSDAKIDAEIMKKTNGRKMLKM